MRKQKVKVIVRRGTLEDFYKNPNIVKTPFVINIAKGTWRNATKKELKNVAESVMICTIEDETQ